MANLMRVNQVARELGISETWLRRAELGGRIPKAQRDINGWRIYSQDDVERIRELLIPVQIQTNPAQTLEAKV